MKLFGKMAFWVAAIAEAFKIANGFLPVKVELPLPEPTRLLVPEDLSLSLIILLAIAPPDWPLSLSLLPLLLLEADELVLVRVLSIDEGPFIFISGCRSASNLNCSIL